jgi:hypothetical protein
MPFPDAQDFYERQRSFRFVLDFVLVSWLGSRVFATYGEKAKKWTIAFKINGLMRVANDDEQRAKMFKSEFLSPVRLPFRHSGRRSLGEGGSGNRSSPCHKPLRRCKLSAWFTGAAHQGRRF